ncbi:MAG TPA: molybdopterin-dependent oxidoreductase, partial [Gemmataceae bacterium]|nr:molybdopterin-dependent oxidoreductase [Gemmataceae bacterium]
MNRRDFLRAALRSFDAVSVENPLGAYPARDWEKVYRDQYRYDSSFTRVCAPNDTHMCRLRAFVRNGVVLRSEVNYDHDRCGDLYGHTATKAWNPRGCPKGYTMHRRAYGPYRLKGPVLRKGWKDWADAGFPSLSDKPELRKQYRFDGRGNDTFVRVPWDEAYKYLAAGLEAVARTYSGDEGKARLVKDGYDPLMIDQVKGAGTRTIKVGSNLPIHGIVGKFGICRLANLLGLLDYHVRRLDDPAQARGARDWNEYTWRGDQAPGQPFVHGLQTSDTDMNDLRFSKLVIQVGKNLIENKMPESHWLNECMERGGKLVDVAPEYNCPATKSNYWIGVRPGLSDTAVFLGVTKILMDEGWYDADFVRRFTDFPLLVRTDTLRRLRPEEVIKDYKPEDLRGGPSYTVQGLTDEQRAKVGDFAVWDAKANKVVAVSRDEVGKNMTVEPALTGTCTVTLVDGETHLPTPTKALWYNNANFLNQAKWVYNIVANVLPRVDLIVDQQIEWTGSAEYPDVVLPVNSWLEFEDYDAGASCSNPFLHIWKGGIRPHRLVVAVRAAEGLQDRPGQHRPRPAPGAQRQNAVGGGKGDEKSVVGAGIPLLLHDGQEPALDALVVVHGRLALDPERQLRRPVPRGQA